MNRAIKQKAAASLLAVSTCGLGFIAGHEGLRPQAYLDAAGVPTICYGHTGGVKMGQSATFEECNALLRKDAGKAGQAIARCTDVTMTQAQYDALVAERNALAHEADTLRIALRAAELAVESANIAAADEQRRTVAAALERSQRAKRADEVIADAKPDPDRADCEWHADERMRLERLYSLYGFTVEAGAGGMPDTLR